MICEQFVHNRSIRERAVLSDAASSQCAHLRSLWEELKCGACRIVHTFFTEHRCYLIVTRRGEGSLSASRKRRVETLELVLSGTPQKAVAIDADLAPSTIAAHARIELQSLGLNEGPSHVNPILVLAAGAPRPDDAARLSCVEDGDNTLRVFSVPRPEERLRRTLTKSELEVIRGIVEGLRYKEIAQLRRRSIRTVANQVASVFRRLGISSRTELLLRLAATDEAPSRRPAAGGNKRVLHARA